MSPRPRHRCRVISVSLYFALLVLLAACLLFVNLLVFWMQQ